jgi:hypothetical protein
VKGKEGGDKRIRGKRVNKCKRGKNKPQISGGALNLAYNGRRKNAILGERGGDGFRTEYRLRS